MQGRWLGAWVVAGGGLMMTSSCRERVRCITHVRAATELQGATRTGASPAPARAREYTHSRRVGGHSVSSGAGTATVRDALQIRDADDGHGDVDTPYDQ